MAKGNTKIAVGGVVLLAVVAVVALGSGAISLPSGDTPAGQTQIGQLTETAPMTSEVGQVFNNNLIANWDGRDSNDPAITYDGQDDYDVICYERITDDVRNWEVLDNGDDSTSNETMNIPVRKTTATDAGVTEMWCEVAVEAGANLIIDKDGTVQANSLVDTCIYEDPDLDQTPTWVCRVNLLNVSPPDPNNTPEINLRLKFIEDATSADLDQTVASIANAGTGKHENRIKLNIDFVTTSTDNGAGAKGLVQITTLFNDTLSNDLWDPNNSMYEIPNGGTIQKIKLSQMDETPFQTQTMYKFKYGSDIATANIINIGKGGDPEVQTPLILTSNFQSADQALCIETEFKYSDAFNAFSVTSVDVEVAEGDVGDECTL